MTTMMPANSPKIPSPFTCGVPLPLLLIDVHHAKTVVGVKDFLHVGISGKLGVKGRSTFARVLFNRLSEKKLTVLL